jgi:uncharacterized spore protein YtfJ
VGAGAGVTINPVAFLIVTQDNVKLLPTSHASSVDKLLDYIPELIDKTSNMVSNCIQAKKEETQKIVNEMHKINEKKNKKEDKTETVKKPKSSIEQDETYEVEYDETENYDD